MNASGGYVNAENIIMQLFANFVSNDQLMIEKWISWFSFHQLSYVQIFCQ